MALRQDKNTILQEEKVSESVGILFANVS